MLGYLSDEQCVSDREYVQEYKCWSGKAINWLTEGEAGSFNICLSAIFLVVCSFLITRRCRPGHRLSNDLPSMIYALHFSSQTKPAKMDGRQLADYFSSL